MSSAPLPPQRSNTAVWWILGIIGGGLVLLVLLGFVFASAVLRHIRVNEANQSVNITTPMGEIKVDKSELHPTGLPVYPGATPMSGNTTSISISANDSGVGVATEQYQTSDPLNKVQGWYRKNLGAEFRLETNRAKFSNEEKQLLDQKDEGVAFVDDHGNGARVVALGEAPSGTTIKLVRAGKREVQ